MKTGPKPSHAMFVIRCARKGFTPLEKYKGLYQPHKVKHSCGLVRVLTGELRGSCSCEHKRPFYLVKRTVKTHTEELKAVKKGYKCLALASTTKGKNKYQCLRCDTKFMSSFDCLKGSSIPCPKCRPTPNLKTHKQYLDLIHSSVEALEIYTGCNQWMDHRLSCRHIEKYLTTKMVTGTKPRCHTCNPSKFRWELLIEGERFVVRSKVERRFIRMAIGKGVRASEIHYEPSETSVWYKNPITKKLGLFKPDFKIRDRVYELKDLSSLGLKGEFMNLGKAPDILAVNRSKALAALDAFGQFDMVVLTDQKFVKIPNDYWSLNLSQLKQRLDTLLTIS